MIHWLVTTDLHQLKVNILYFRQHYIFQYYALVFVSYRVILNALPQLRIDVNLQSLVPYCCKCCYGMDDKAT